MPRGQREDSGEVDQGPGSFPGGSMPAEWAATSGSQASAAFQVVPNAVGEDDGGQEVAQPAAETRDVQQEEEKGEYKEDEEVGDEEMAEQEKDDEECESDMEEEERYVSEEGDGGNEAEESEDLTYYDVVEMVEEGEVVEEDGEAAGEEEEEEEEFDDSELNHSEISNSEDFDDSKFDVSEEEEEGNSAEKNTQVGSINSPDGKVLDPTLEYKLEYFFRNLLNPGCLCFTSETDKSDCEKCNEEARGKEKKEEDKNEDLEEGPPNNCSP